MSKILYPLVFISIFISAVGIPAGYSAPKLKVNPATFQIDPTKLPSKVIIEIDALNALSPEYLDTSNVISFNLATKALRLSKLVQYKEGEAYAYANLGLCYYGKKNFLEAFENFMASLNIAEPNQFEFVLNKAYNGMGLIFMDLGRRDKAIEYIRKGMAYAKKFKTEDLAGSYIRLGKLMFEKGDTNEAFRLYFNALSLKPKLTRLVSWIWVMKSIGNLYLSVKQYDIALYYYREVIKENPKDLGNLNGTTYSLMAHTYEQKNDLNNALYYNKIALALRKNEKRQLLIISSLLNIGNGYLRIGKYDSSLYYLLTGLKNANLFKINFLREAGYKYLYELYLAKRDWKNALSALHEFNSAQDLVEEEESKDQVTLLENNRIVNEKEKLAEKLRNENAIQKLEMKNRNLLVLLLITLSFLTIAVAVYTLQSLVKNKKAKKIVEEQNDQLQYEIKDKEEILIELEKQTEILIKEVHHRVKNNLATLTSLVNMQKSEFTDLKTLNIFSDLQFRVRAMALVHEQLYKSRNIEVLPIGEYLSNLVAVVSSAYSTKRVEVHQDFYDEIVDVETTLPLGLIVNELLTNAYKYAFPDHREGNIWVTYKEAPKRITSQVEMRCLTVRDDGIGLPPDFDLSQTSSMGSQIIHLLTQQLEGEIKIDGTKGASFSIILPLER